MSNYVDVKKRVEELHCNMPVSIALLPRNFADARSRDELVHESTAPTVRTLWRQNAITETPLERPGEKFPMVSEKAFTAWICPVIFVSYLLMSQNPHMITVALNIISNYLTGWFKGIPKDHRRVKLDIIVETKGANYKRVEYEGPLDGLRDLPAVIKEVNDE